MPDIPELHTRRPTGKPPWPMIVLAGGEKTGKSRAAAEFSRSNLIDRMFWCELGEGAADQYGALPGADYEILRHDGSYQSIGAELWKATKQPRRDGRPHAFVVDPVGALWEMLSDEAQGIANARARRAAAKRREPLPEGDRTVGPDLWNGAKARWKRIINLLRKYDGPVILLARLEQVAVMDKDGKPTTDRTWSIKAEKNLPHEADAVVRFTGYRTAELTGVRSVVLEMEPGETRPLPDFTIDGLLRDLGLAEPDATAPRTFVAPKPDWMEAERDMEGAYERQPQGQQQSRLIAPPADAPRPQPTEVRQAGASTSVQNKLLGLIEGKLDITDRDDQMRWISGELRRHVATPDQLGVGEALGLIRRLESTPDREQPWDEQPQVSPPDDAEPTTAELYSALESGHPEVAADAAEMLLDRGLPPDRAAVSWSHRMLDERGTPMDGPDAPPGPLTEAQRAQLVAWYVDQIGSVDDERDLGRIGAQAQDAYTAKRLRQSEVNLINAAYARRMQELRGRVGADA